MSGDLQLNYVKFESLINKQPDDGCWEWTGCKNRQGYGVFWYRGGQTVLAHRLSFALEVGPIDENKEIHHICENPGCVRPDHLQQVTKQEHFHLKPGLKRYLDRVKSAPFCKYGHPRDPSNIDPKGCRACKKTRNSQRSKKGVTTTCQEI